MQARRDPGNGADDGKQRRDGVQDFGHECCARSDQASARTWRRRAHGAGRRTRPASAARDRARPSSDYADFFADFFFAAAFLDADFLADDFFAATFFDADFLAGDFFATDFFVADFFAADFFDADFFDADFPEADFFEADFFAAVFFGGTFAPARRASDRPIAIACFRLLTFLPEPPLRSVPSLRSCMTLPTFACAFFPYLAMSLLHWTGTSCAILHQPRYRVTSGDLHEMQTP
jgi:hypothetical protein